MQVGHQDMMEGNRKIAQDLRKQSLHLTVSLHCFHWVPYTS